MCLVINCYCGFFIPFAGGKLANKFTNLKLAKNNNLPTENLKKHSKKQPNNTGKSEDFAEKVDYPYKPIKGRISNWQNKPTTKLFGFFNINIKSFNVRFKPSANIIKIVPKGPTNFTNSIN